MIIGTNGCPGIAGAGEQQVNQSGLVLGAAWLSEEGSVRPATWHCEARYPSAQYSKTLTLRVCL